MSAITLQWDSKDLTFWREGRAERALISALSKAGGDAARLLKSGSSKLIRGRKRFKVAKINDALDLEYPRGAKTVESLVWTMNVAVAPMPLGALPVSQTKRGVTVAVNVGKRPLLAHAFIATLKSGHRGVFTRAFPGAPRLPIAEVFTSRISDVFFDRGFIDFVEKGAQDKFTESFNRLLPLELAKVKK